MPVEIQPREKTLKLSPQEPRIPLHSSQIVPFGRGERMDLAGWETERPQIVTTPFR